MSTRLTLHGEHVALAPEVTVVEQAVESLGALWRQRMRWAEGSLRRLIELGPPLVAAIVLCRSGGGWISSSSSASS